MVSTNLKFGTFQSRFICMKNKISGNWKKIRPYFGSCKKINTRKKKYSTTHRVTVNLCIFMGKISKCFLRLVRNWAGGQVGRHSQTERCFIGYYVVIRFIYCDFYLFSLKLQSKLKYQHNMITKINVFYLVFCHLSEEC